MTVFDDIGDGVERLFNIEPDHHPKIQKILDEIVLHEGSYYWVPKTIYSDGSVERDPNNPDPRTNVSYFEENALDELEFQTWAWRESIRFMRMELRDPKQKLKEYDDEIFDVEQAIIKLDSKYRLKVSSGGNERRKIFIKLKNLRNAYGARGSTMTHKVYKKKRKKILDELKKAPSNPSTDSIYLMKWDKIDDDPDLGLTEWDLKDLRADYVITRDALKKKVDPKDSALKRARAWKKKLKTPPKKKKEKK
jgi:hypothetical protein